MISSCHTQCRVKYSYMLFFFQFCRDTCLGWTSTKQWSYFKVSYCHKYKNVWSRNTTITAQSRAPWGRATHTTLTITSHKDISLAYFYPDQTPQNAASDQGFHYLLIPLFHTGPESHGLPQIAKYLDSWLKHTQFVKILTESHSP